jgi:hypothetical protein
MVSPTKKGRNVTGQKKGKKKRGAGAACDRRGLLSWPPEGKRISRCVRVVSKIMVKQCDSFCSLSD